MKAAFKAATEFSASLGQGHLVIRLLSQGQRVSAPVQISLKLFDATVDSVAFCTPGDELLLGFFQCSRLLQPSELLLIRRPLLLDLPSDRGLPEIALRQIR